MWDDASASEYIGAPASTGGLQFLGPRNKSVSLSRGTRAVPHGMDHNNKHLLPGFQFPNAFAGLQNAGTSAFMSTLSHHLSSLNPLLPTPGLSTTDIATWAAATQNTQPWLDHAKVAAILPSLSFFGVKGLDLAQQTELLAQAAQQGLASSAVSSDAQSSLSTSIFPSLLAAQVAMSKPPSPKIPTPKTTIEDSFYDRPLSNAPSSHPSTSTPHEIDVGGNSQPSSQIQAFDLSIRNSPQIVSPEETIVVDEKEPAVTTKKPNTFSALELSTSSKQKENLLLRTLSVEDSSQPVDDHSRAASDVVEKDSGAPRTHSFPSFSIASTSSAGEAAVESPAKDAEAELGDIFDMMDDGPDPMIENIDSDQLASYGMHNIEPRFSPVQFTPPDSPTKELEDDDMEPQTASPLDFARPTPCATPMLPTTPVKTKSELSTVPPAPACPRSATPAVAKTTPKKNETKLQIKEAALPKLRSEFVHRTVQPKSSKVPVYKQKRLLQSVVTEIKKPLVKEDNKAGGDDAYSFDEEEDQGLAKMDARERLDAEVKEKLSKMANQPSQDGKNKNIYVPGVGFAVPHEQTQDLWRHVVPKKRPVGENRPIIPAANLLPSSVHAEASQAAARLAEPEIVTLAESIRRRKKDRFVCAFIKTEQTTSDECFKEDGADQRAEQMRLDLENHPRLPKLVIKLPKRSADEYREKRQRKKKRRRRDDSDDSDWEGSERTRRRRNKLARMERRSSRGGYEVRIVEPEPVKPVEEEKVQDMSMFSKKRRLMMQWQEEEGQENKNRENGDNRKNGSHAAMLEAIRRNEFNTAAVKARLSKFGPADGYLPKGTFVVAKSDLFRDDCALWRVDNQNLLQKYPPRTDAATQRTTYKNSSTYSGWCDQIASGYYKVAVKHIKQSRSEAVIEPEIPLCDLFPAMTSECDDYSGVQTNEGEERMEANEHMTMLRDPLRMSLYTYTQIMIEHALTLEYLQVMKQKNDWNFLQAVTEIDRVNTECLAKLRNAAKLSDFVEKALNSYTQMFVCDADYHAVGCQGCVGDKKPVEKIIQLLALESYDNETLFTTSPTNDENVESQLPATEILLCAPCALASRQYHRCHHMKYHLLKKCEDKLESIGTQHPEHPPEKIVDLAKKSRSWQNGVFQEYLDLWKKIQSIPSIVAPANSMQATQNAPPANCLTTSNSFLEPPTNFLEDPPRCTETTQKPKSPVINVTSPVNETSNVKPVV